MEPIQFVSRTLKLAPKLDVLVRERRADYGVVPVLSEYVECADEVHSEEDVVSVEDERQMRLSNLDVISQPLG